MRKGRSVCGLRVARMLPTFEWTFETQCTTDVTDSKHIQRWDSLFKIYLRSHKNPPKDPILKKLYPSRFFTIYLSEKNI